MPVYCDPDDYWLCPYDLNHKVLAKRFQYHIMRCAKANPHIRRVKCSFNATHLTTPNELFKHMSTCPDNQTVHDAIARGMSDFNWEDHSSDNNERQMAVIMNGEDWDREAHTGNIFNDDELRQLNGQNEMWSHSITPAVPSTTIPSRPQSSYLDRDGILSSRESPKQIPQTIASYEPKRTSVYTIGGSINQSNSVADASLDSQFENIRRNMLATGVGRGRLPTTPHPPAFNEFNEGIFSMNSSLLCSLLSIRHKVHIEKFSSSNTCDLFEKYGRVVQGWNIILTNHIKICQTSLYKIYLNDIIQYQYLVCRSLLDLIKESKNKNWHIPILILTLTELRLLTNYFTINISTDINGRISPPTQRIAELSINNDRQISETHVNKTIELLTEAFRVCTSDRCTEQRLSKKWGAIQILNQLLKLCHRIKRYELGEQLLSFAEQSLEYRHYLLEDQKMTYDYFLGKSALFKDDYRKATECFDPIFQRCPQFMKKNKSSILIHLCISKMQFGYTPCLKIILKYKLNAFYDLLISIKQGQLYEFDQYIKIIHHKYFLSKGLLLHIETLYLLAVRNLFRQVWLLMNKENKISIEIFTRALEWSNHGQTCDQIECATLLATLICQNRIKAYISYKHMIVVLSKEDPFPKIQQII
ncbi:unnamed protein product [Rotaria sp. Silwood1]|nr:unnamed protein product [Rotaria sp. Silwood1]